MRLSRSRCEMVRESGQLLAALEIALGQDQSRLAPRPPGLRRARHRRHRAHGSIRISRSPCLTSAPSRKWISWMAPATRERISTRSTASSRPENSSHGTVSRGVDHRHRDRHAPAAPRPPRPARLPLRPLRKVTPPADRQCGQQQRHADQVLVLDDISHGRPQFDRPCAALRFEQTELCRHPIRVYAASHTFVTSGIDGPSTSTVKSLI